MPELLLFLRLLSALLLLAFVGAIGWLIYQDMRLTAVSLANQQKQRGQLRVIASNDKGPTVGALFPLLPVTSIGRATSSTIVLDDGYVSAEHTLITQRGQQWWVEDLGSRNGTLLNRVMLEETAVISPGDIITIGDTQLKVEF